MKPIQQRRRFLSMRSRSVTLPLPKKPEDGDRRGTH
jgi:hypothetical protein